MAEPASQWNGSNFTNCAFQVFRPFHRARPSQRLHAVGPASGTLCRISVCYKPFLFHPFPGYALVLSCSLSYHILSISILQPGLTSQSTSIERVVFVGSLPQWLDTLEIFGNHHFESSPRLKSAPRKASLDTGKDFEAGCYEVYGFC